nr:cell division protein FtsW [Rheinheimera sp.]
MKQLALSLLNMSWPNPLQGISNWWNAEDGAAYDKLFLTLLLLILAVGVVMVTSASVPVATRLYDNELHFTIRHLVYLALGFSVALLVLNVPVQWWHNSNMLLLFAALALLVAVLLFGRNVNGSTRWLAIGPVGL